MAGYGDLFRNSAKGVIAQNGILNVHVGSNLVIAEMHKPGYTFILASKKRGTLYIGVTSALPTVQGRLSAAIGNTSSASWRLTKEYNAHRLVYHEQYDGIYDAIAREKQLKKWNWAWKIRQIEKENPNWYDQ